MFYSSNISRSRHRYDLTRSSAEHQKLLHKQVFVTSTISRAVDVRLRPRWRPYCNACLSPLLSGSRDIALRNNGGRSQGMVYTLLRKDPDSSRQLCS
jgi:RNase P subunit RPR2